MEKPQPQLLPESEVLDSAPAPMAEDSSLLFPSSTSFLSSALDAQDPMNVDDAPAAVAPSSSESGLEFLSANSHNSQESPVVVDPIPLSSSSSSQQKSEQDGPSSSSSAPAAPSDISSSAPVSSVPEAAAAPLAPSSEQKKKSQSDSSSTKIRCKIPELPFYPKLLPFPFAPNRLYAYKTTSLELSHQYEIHPPLSAEMVVPIDLADPFVYTRPKENPVPALHPSDASLLQDGPSEKFGDSSSALKRKRAKTEYSWLRKTSYIASEDSATGVAKGPKLAGTPKAAGKEAEDEEMEEDVDSMTTQRKVQIVEKTFADAAEMDNKGLANVRHPSNRGLRAVQVLPVLPFSVITGEADAAEASADGTEGTILLLDEEEEGKYYLFRIVPPFE